MSQNIGRVALSTKGRDHVIANVAASEGEKIIQLKSDRRTTHELTVDVGREKCRASSVLWKVNALAIALHEVDPLCPGHSRVIIESKKVETGALELRPCSECRCFVGEIERSEDERRSETLTVRPSVPTARRLRDKSFK